MIRRQADKIHVLDFRKSDRDCATWLNHEIDHQDCSTNTLETYPPLSILARSYYCKHNALNLAMFSVEFCQSVIMKFKTIRNGI